jgi:pimeloyl-ACP methyl ester carboxylesterase
VTLELTRRAKTSLGEIAYEVLGDGPPVVLVHGTPSRAVVWRRVAPVLATGHRVYVFDLLGFGGSERHVEQDVGLAAHGRVLRELVAGWGLTRPAAVGHDIGGATVLRAHLLEGVPFSRIALIDAVVLRPWITPTTRQMQGEIARYEPLPSAELEGVIRAHLGTATAQPLAADAYSDIFGQWDGATGQALYLRNLACLDERDTDAFQPLLTTITAPVLVLWGEQDAWLPVETSERIAAVIPSARRVIVRRAGHFSMEDRPDVVAAELSAFLDEELP